jgi:hypothetical protein
MKRSVFYDGVEIYSEHLNYIEESKAEAIKNIVLTFGICGPVRGLVVAPDPNDAYKVMITAGVGYTYGGEYYELTSNVTGVVVSNAIGVKNYICVKVTEVDEYPLPNVVTSEVKYTRKNQRYDVLVLGETDWQNLADKSMYSLLAIVYGSGGFVRGSDIRRAVVIPASLLFVEQQPVVIRGVKVVTVSNNTPLGKGALGYRYDNVERKSYLKWKAPGGAGFGAEVVIGSDGVYKLWDQLGVSYLQVEVSVADLLAESVNEELQIIDMLEQRELNTGTMIDVLHRSMMGGGMPSIRNPHGQTLDDLEPGEVQDVVKHQRRFHTAGIIGEPGSNTLRPSIASSAEIQLQSVVVGEYVVSGGKLYSNIQPLMVNFSGKVGGTYYVYINDEGVIEAKTGIVDDKQYFVICSVRWDGFLLDSDSLVDLRRWGVVTPERVSADRSGDRMLDPHLNVAYDLSDNLAMLRWVLKVILGGTSWYDIPAYTLKDLQDAYTHIGLSYLSGIAIHGVKLGHTGGLDADMLDGKHLSEILDGTVANADKLDGVHKDTGHAIDGSGIDADKLDGKHLSEILDGTVANADKLDGVHKDTGHTIDGSGINADKLDGKHLSEILDGTVANADKLDGVHKDTGHTIDGSGINADKLDGVHKDTGHTIDGSGINADKLDGVHKDTGHTIDGSGINADKLDGVHKDTGHTIDGSGINADKLDGKHLSEILDGTVANADKLDGVHKDTGHTIDGSGINADKLDGKHLSEILDGTVANADKLDGKHLSEILDGTVANADMLDGKHLSEILDGTVANADKLDGVHKDTGHTIDGSGIDADKLDGKHLSEILNGTVANADMLDGHHGDYYLNRANHTGTQAPGTISPQGHGSGLDADKLDGFHASQTPAANVIPVTLDTGMLSSNWIDFRYFPHYRVTVDTEAGNRTAPDQFIEANYRVWRYPSFGSINWCFTDWGRWSTLWQMKVVCDSAISVTGGIGSVDDHVYIYLNNQLVISKGIGVHDSAFTLNFIAGENLLQIVHNSSEGGETELEIWLDLPWSLSFRFVYIP